MKYTRIDYDKPADPELWPVPPPKSVETAQQQNFSQHPPKEDSAHGLELLVGSSPGMAQVRALIRQAGRGDGTVLIVGESGTGKELVAKALHDVSPRAGRPFVDVNCAALTETLIESELFGYEKGAFTSAISRHRGKFEQAHGGTLFLDEIGDMPLATQAKMLRVLQERSFQRVGGEERISVNVRVVCATNHNLEAAVQKGSFRMDLFYRINMMVIEVRPLREQPSDIPELAQHFLTEAVRSRNYIARGISEAALMALSVHNWPGNVRELQNAMERALTVCEEEEIQPSHLPPAVLRQSPPPAQAIGDTAARNLVEAVERFERAMILAALERCDWNRVRAASDLRVTPRVLAYKINKLRIGRSLRENQNHNMRRLYYSSRSQSLNLPVSPKPLQTGNRPSQNNYEGAIRS